MVAWFDSHNKMGDSGFDQSMLFCKGLSRITHKSRSLNGSLRVVFFVQGLWHSLNTRITNPTNHKVSCVFILLNSKYRGITQQRRYKVPIQYMGSNMRCYLRPNIIKFVISLSICSVL